MKTLTLLLSLSISLLAISCSSYKQAGIQDAERDFAKGIMQIETYGELLLESPYENHLRKNGVTMKVVAGCMVDDEIVQHAEGYNLTMKRLINQRLGKNLFIATEKARQ